MGRAVLSGWSAFDLVAAVWERGGRSADDLPPAAEAALVAGCDSPSLRVVAGLTDPGWSELRPLLVAIRKERGLLPFTAAEVDELRMVDAVGQIATGAVTPQDGARTVFLLLSDLDRFDDDDLSLIAYLDDDYDLIGVTFPSVAELDAEVVDRSRAFLLRRGITV